MCQHASDESRALQTNVKITVFVMWDLFKRSTHSQDRDYVMYRIHPSIRLTLKITDFVSRLCGPATQQQLGSLEREKGEVTYLRPLPQRPKADGTNKVKAEAQLSPRRTGTLGALFESVTNVDAVAAKNKLSVSVPQAKKTRRTSPRIRLRNTAARRGPAGDVPHLLTFFLKKPIKRKVGINRCLLLHLLGDAFPAPGCAHRKRQKINTVCSYTKRYISMKTGSTSSQACTKA